METSEKTGRQAGPLVCFQPDDREGSGFTCEGRHYGCDEAAFIVASFPFAAVNSCGGLVAGADKDRVASYGTPEPGEDLAKRVASWGASAPGDRELAELCRQTGARTAEALEIGPVSGDALRRGENGTAGPDLGAQP